MKNTVLALVLLAMAGFGALVACGDKPAQSPSDLASSASAAVTDTAAPAHSGAAPAASGH